MLEVRFRNLGLGLALVLSGCGKEAASGYAIPGSTQEQTRHFDFDFLVDPEIGWRTDAPGIVGVVANEDVVVATTQVGEVMAFDLSTGTPRWTTNLEASIGTSPVIFGNWIYVATDAGKLNLLSLETGEIKAFVKLDGPASAEPAMILTTVITSTLRGTIVAVEHPAELSDSDEDKESEPLELEPMWRAKIAAPIRAPVSAHGDQLIVSGTDGFVYALSFQEGSKLWTWEGTRAHRHPAVYSENLWFVASDDGNVHALNTETGSIQWSVPTLGPVSTPLVVGHQRVIASNSTGRITAFDQGSDVESWRYNIAGGLRFAPSATKDALYLVTAAGELHALSLVDGELKWTFSEVAGKGTPIPVKLGVLLPSTDELVLVRNK